MKKPWTALCSCAGYWSITVTVEAETLDEALRRPEMKRRLARTLFMGPAIAGVMAGLAAGPGAGTASAQDRCELPREIVVGEPGNQVVVERRGARSEGALLEELHGLTLLKWGASLVLPALARNELAIYLHESTRAGFLAEYDDIETIQRLLVLPRAPGGTTIPGRPRVRQANRSGERCRKGEAIGRAGAPCRTDDPGRRTTPRCLARQCLDEPVSGRLPAAPAAPRNTQR